MKHLTVLQAHAVGAIALSAGLFGAGVATAASEYDGQTYADAAAAISESGGTPVIVTRVGDQLPQDECIVMNAQDHSFLRPDTEDVYMVSVTDEVRLHLNCAGGFATATDPGSSVASPAGRAAQDAAAEAAAAEEQELAAADE